MLRPFSTRLQQRAPSAGAPEADQPAEHDVVGEREGRRPDAHVRVFAQSRSATAALPRSISDDAEPRCSGLQQEHDQKPQRRARRSARGRGRRPTLAPIAGAERLRRQAGRAGAQEIEGDEDDVEDDRADRRCRRSAPASPSWPITPRLTTPTSGDGQVGERHRHGEAETRRVRHLEGTDAVLLRGCHSARRLPPSLKQPAEDEERHDDQRAGDQVVERVGEEGEAHVVDAEDRRARPTSRCRRGGCSSAESTSPTMKESTSRRRKTRSGVSPRKRVSPCMMRPDSPAPS